MSNSETSSLNASTYYRRNIMSGTATQVHTTVLTSSVNSSSTTATTEVYKSLPQQQESLPATTTYHNTTTPSTAACLSKSSSCPDSPIRRVSSSLRNSAVGFATRFFNKCRAATFTVDGATYTIGKLQ
ncbi:hypothetical protein FF38_14415 [Lucilia cuprina]|uniref:Uncharacterized protein n=1 Tax=Lucilia cuprina TaxID=7375 RepID=A0A0L0CFN4_LUCCU|nr:hypothetical protein FF38_14415 [Lucilia cuprina]